MSASEDIRHRRNQISQLNFRLADSRESLRHAERDLEEARFSEHSDDEELIANLESDIQAIEEEIREMEDEVSSLEREIEDLEHEYDLGSLD